MCKKFTPDELNKMDHKTKDDVIYQMQDRLGRLEQNYENLVEQIRLANQQRFGRHTEKLDDIAGRLSFFYEAEANYDEKVKEPTVEEVIDSSRKMPRKPKKKGQCEEDLLWSSFFVTLVAKKIVLINLCCRPCFIWGSITIITVWTNMIIINVCKFFYLLIECFLCCKLIQICAFILQGIEVTLHRCIVVRISCFAHALCHIYRFAEFGKCFGRIL